MIFIILLRGCHHCAIKANINIISNIEPMINDIINNIHKYIDFKPGTI